MLAIVTYIMHGKIRPSHKEKLTEQVDTMVTPLTCI